MGNPKANSVVPLTAAESSGLIERTSEQAIDPGSAEQSRDFHFAVTWVTLFAHLDPIEATGPRPRVETPQPTFALVPVVAAPVIEQRAEQRAERNSEAIREHAAWEMVVPKMIRTGSGSFAPDEPGKRQLL
jgi:hypothetical protein